MQTKRITASIVFFLFFLFFAIGQEERIISYDVEVTVNKDRSIDVIEKIVVFANGQRIKRGLTRNLPQNRDMQGKSTKLKYNIQNVYKDNQPENFFTKQNGSDLVLYTGEQNVFLSPGQYAYEIHYSVPNQVSMLEAYDEIYWNAIGTNVQFSIEQASATFNIPEGASIIQEAAYMGAFGSKEKSFTRLDDYGSVVYKVTRQLLPYEGLSIGIGFQKGFIDEPGVLEKFASLLVVILGFIILLPYYIFTWFKHGIDPPKPAPYPIFNSPNNLSSASLNYIKREQYQNKSLTASIIDLAIKGFIKIEEEEKSGLLKFGKNYRLVKLKEDDGSLPQEESEIFRTLLLGRDSTLIDGDYHPHVEDAYTLHKATLRSEHRSFLRTGDNLRLLTVPVLLVIATIAISAILLAKSTVGEELNTIIFGAFIPFGIVSLIIYAWLIRKPTPEKLALQSEIEGFKMYLEMAEKDRLRLLNPPERTPEHFEEMLPYAFALGVEHKWTKNFKSILDSMQYKPEWCNTPPIYFVGNFGSGFSRQVMGSATQPSSDGSGGGFGGSGGGGFSGGGGGGGGVGGW